MKVQGTDILSDVTEKTSRNLKVTAAVVIAVKAFSVPVKDLRILNIDLPATLFDVVSIVVIAYMIIILVLYWRVDYLLWRDGSILAAKEAIDQHLRSITTIMEQIEQFVAQGATDQVKFVEDHFAGIKVEVLDYRRSIAKTTWWVRFVVFVLHLIVPLGLGAIAVLMVALTDWVRPELAGFCSPSSRRARDAAGFLGHPFSLPFLRHSFQEGSRSPRPS
jgi:hypothetical protein